MDREIIIIAHNLRSCQNVGSLLRTADGLGVKKVYLTGYTPYPIPEVDTRLPYLREKIAKRINKTSLGAENYVDWNHVEDIEKVIVELKSEKYQIIALEQTEQSVNLEEFTPNIKLAIILGREVEGIESEVLDLADNYVSIPMKGFKESFNVTLAATMALYKFRYF